MISKEEFSPLIAKYQTHQSPLDPNQPINAIKFFEDILAAAIRGGSSSGREYHTKAAYFTKRLASFAASDRGTI